MLWRGKPLYADVKRKAHEEILANELTEEELIEVLEEGIEMKRRRKGIIERWLRKGRFIVIVCIEDCHDYWLIRHVGRIIASKKKIRLLRGM